MKIIKKSTSIFDLVKAYPDIKEIMVELGFKDLTKPGMLQTAGRIMTLEKGSKMKHIPMKQIIDVFQNHGYQLID
ncbi:MAG: DUF1858 domain-containing protein [Candidatus Izimaplasma sp.]|nr:DUF1858 domain-containing protein [Candidatus Izimaplasma bacterium]